jgi:hypothetical protein
MSRYFVFVTSEFSGDAPNSRTHAWRSQAQTVGTVERYTCAPGFQNFERSPVSRVPKLGSLLMIDHRIAV